MLFRLCNLLWRLLLAGVLLLAAWGKFSEGIEAPPWRTIYDRMVASIAWRHYAILAIEALMALWLLAGVKVRWAAAATTVILTGFSAILIAELWRTNPSACGCGLRQIYPGGDPRTELWIDLVRNAILLLGCGWLWIFGLTNAAAHAPSSPTPLSPSPPSQ
jgi:hypothetical protein